MFNRVKIMTANSDKRKMGEKEVSKAIATITISEYHSSSFPNNSLTVTWCFQPVCPLTIRTYLNGGKSGQIATGG